jgi:chloramphenicol-sensitive protein RarD
VKKKAPMRPLAGLTLETGLLFLPALAFLAVEELRGAGAFGHAGLVATLLMMGAGIVTTVPLLLFATAVRHVSLSVIGILQFIAPTIQFLLGVFAYGEPFSRSPLAGFGLVWTAVAVFAVDGMAHVRQRVVRETAS